MMKQRRVAVWRGLIFAALAVGLVAVFLRVVIVIIGVQEGADEGYAELIIFSLAGSVLFAALLVMVILRWTTAALVGGIENVREERHQGLVCVIACPDDPERQLDRIALGRSLNAPKGFKLVVLPEGFELWSGPRPKLVARCAASDARFRASLHTRLFRSEPVLVIECALIDGPFSLITYPVREDSVWFPRSVDAAGVAALAEACQRFAAGGAGPEGETRGKTGA